MSHQNHYHKWAILQISVYNSSFAGGWPVPVLKFVRRTLITIARMAPHFGLVVKRPRRFFVFDPFLISAGSHNFNFDLGFREALERKGWSVTILANRYASDGVIADAKAHRLFVSTAYLEFTPFFEAFSRRNGDFYRDLRLFDFANFSPDNIVLVHTITAFELFGLARWYQELPESSRPRLIVYIQLGPALGLKNDTEEIRQVLEAYRSIGSTLSRNQGVILCTTSRRLADLFPAGSISPNLFPLPISWPAEQSPRPDNGRVVFAYVGGARDVKGFHLLPDAIATALDTVPNVDFLIHSPHVIEFSEEISRLRQMGSRVQVRERPPSNREGYYALFDEVDVILNAYDPTQYGEATSMICLEAIGMGKGLITTSGTWSEEIAGHIGAATVVMKGFSSTALADAIVTYATHYQELANKAALAQKRAREDHNVDTFLAATGLDPFAQVT
jgi:glycosyltransferase involved in cell wall biosynthesis